MTDSTKNYRITTAVDKLTHDAVSTLAFESNKSPSQIVNDFVLNGLSNNPKVMKSTSRDLKIQLVTQKTDELVSILQNIDKFYQFKVNLWQICLLLSGKLGPNTYSIDDPAISDIKDLMNSIKTTEPELYKECIYIMKFSLNKSLKNEMLPKVE